MTYIINPWFFYFVNLLGSFWTLISIVLFLAIIGAVGFSVWWLMETYNSDFFVHDDNEHDDNEHDNNEHDNNESPFAKFCKKIIKVSVIVTIISAVLMVAVPSEETVNKMMISSFITKENIEKAKEGAKEGAKEIVDYIAEKAIELKKAE